MKRFIKIIIHIIFFITIALGCIKNDKMSNYELAGKVNALWNKKIMIDNSLFNTHCLTSYKNKSYKIVTTVDGDCSCSIEALEKWQEYKITIKESTLKEGGLERRPL